MRVVVVGSGLPYPANSGSRIRTLSLLVRLARRHRVTFVGVRNADRAAARAAREYLGDHGVATVEAPHAVPPKSGLKFYARLAANLASPLPYAVASFSGPALAETVRRVVGRGGVELCQAEGLAGAEALRGLAGVPRVLDAHNVETLIWERYAATESNVLKRGYVRLQARKFERLERRAFAEAGRVVAVSEEDAALMTGRFGVAADRVDVVANGIDRDAFEAVVPAPEASRILFLGSLDWRPNLDALDVMLDPIFPAVRASEPSAVLDVVGRNPPPALVRRAAGQGGATIHADVADVRPYLTRAAVMAVPLRVGGGSRLKILEALATGLPVVSTAVGAEGLDLRHGAHLEIADTPEAFAASLVHTLRNPAAARATAARGRALVLDRYDWDVQAEALERSWERCVASRSRDSSRKSRTAVGQPQII
jgi:glycosyltransferase involved in cell wall biosynthesis